MAADSMDFYRNCEVRTSLRGTKQSISAVIARYEAIQFRRHCEVRSNPGCPVWIASYLAMTRRQSELKIDVVK
ncbi:MAG: hypothetical protein LBS88_08660 [Tannerellaceae bacterium]|nr:hypothetical protein [Tannerellaceae bacterium]